MLTTAVIYLAAAIVSVSIAKRIGLGSVLGYLFAGVLIGPSVLGWVGDQTDVMHVAEFGVVMMLFLIGLELQPQRLWKLRHSILGLGGLQVVLTALAVYVIAYYVLQWPWQSALVLGFILALSSTAIVMQSLAERGLTRQEGGQNAFSVLLFQDMAVIPMLAALPMLAFAPDIAQASSTASLISHWSATSQAVTVILVIVGIIVAGKYVAAPVFRYIAETHLKEVFTLFALFLVVAIAALMEVIGVSPALGTFLAGVVLAESEFRHELEVDIEPFKGLLLGLFFITVGASIDFPLFVENWDTVLLAVIALMAGKGVVLYVLAVTFKMASMQRLLFAFALAQGGEFGFVLLAMSNGLQLLSSEQISLITLVVAISMLLAPLMFIVFDRLNRRLNTKSSTPINDEPIEPTNSVIIAGYGRFGQIIGRLLSAQGYHLTILDHSPSQIDLLRRFGSKVHFGDAARLDLLEAAGAHEAKMLVVAIDDPDKSLDIITKANKHFPHLKIVARAIDRRHTYQIMRLNVAAFKRETFDSAVNLGIQALEILGNSADDAQRAGALFSAHDEQSLKVLSELWGDDHSYGVAVRQRLEDLKQVLQADKAQQQALNTCHAEEKEG